jgi:hypothetical protein
MKTACFMILFWIISKVTLMFAIANLRFCSLFISLLFLLWIKYGIIIRLIYPFKDVEMVKFVWFCMLFFFRGSDFFSTPQFIYEEYNNLLLFFLCSQILIQPIFILLFIPGFIIKSFKIIILRIFNCCIYLIINFVWK